MAVTPIFLVGFGGGGGPVTPAFVSGTKSANTNSVTKSVTAGNLLVVMSILSGIVTPTISDGVNTWNLIGGSLFPDSSNGFTMGYWWAIAATTASITVTITPNGGTTPGLSLGEFSGIVTTSPIDGTPGSTQDQTGTTVADAVFSGSTTTAVDGDLILSFIIFAQVGENTLQFTPSTGWTKLTSMCNDPSGGGSQDSWAFSMKIQTTHGAINPTWTTVTADVFDGITVAFKHA